MTTQVEGQTAYVPENKELGNETTTTSSAASVDAEKADRAMAEENKDAVFETDEKAAPVEAAVDDDSDGEADYLPIGPKMILITISLMMAVFCVALDNTVGLHKTKSAFVLLLILLRSSL
jgi:hypothetical protein